jgi:hypothetical protein
MLKREEREANQTAKGRARSNNHMQRSAASKSHIVTSMQHAAPADVERWDASRLTAILNYAKSALHLGQELQIAENSRCFNAPV